MIRHPDARREKAAHPRQPQAVVEFHVLAGVERLVERADPVEHLAPVAARIELVRVGLEHRLVDLASLVAHACLAFRVVLGRVRLVSFDVVLTAAEECFDRIVELYAKPNRTMAELATTLHSGEFEVLEHFSDACRIGLRKYSVY